MQIFRINRSSRPPRRLFYLFILGVVITSCGVQEQYRDPDPCEEPPYCTPKIYSDTTITWGPENGPILLDRDIVIDSSSTLEILPGTQIQYMEESVYVWDGFGGQTRSPFITVYGNIFCNGQLDNPVRFFNEGNYTTQLFVHTKNGGYNEMKFKWVVGLGSLWVYERAFEVRNSNISIILIEQCDSVVIENNSIDYVSFCFSSGAFRKNNVSETVFALQSSITIDGNIISSEGEPKLYGFRSHNDDVFVFTNNVVRNRTQAIYVFSGSPTINYNNITDYDIAVEIVPHWNDADADTLDFTNNWWGTSSGNYVRSRIEYSQNGGTDSEKVIIIDPVATESFDLDR